MQGAHRDAEGVVLWLNVDPQEFDIDFDRLVKFYESRGFRFVGDDGSSIADSRPSALLRDAWIRLQ